MCQPVHVHVDVNHGYAPILRVLAVSYTQTKKADMNDFQLCVQKEPMDQCSKNAGASPWNLFASVIFRCGCIFLEDSDCDTPDPALIKRHCILSIRTDNEAF